MLTENSQDIHFRRKTSLFPTGVNELFMPKIPQKGNKQPKMLEKKKDQEEDRSDKRREVMRRKERNGEEEKQ